MGGTRDGRLGSGRAVMPTNNTVDRGRSQAVSQSSRQAGSTHGGSSQGPKKHYLYCIDTRQITSMLAYSIKMLQVPRTEIEQVAKQA